MTGLRVRWWFWPALLGAIVLSAATALLINKPNGVLVAAAMGGVLGTALIRAARSG